MDDSITLILYLVIAAIVGIVTLIRKVMEKATSGEAGRKINLAQVVQEQMERYMKGGPPGRFGGRGFPGGEERATATPAPRTVPPPILKKAAPARPKAAPDPAARRLYEKQQPLKVESDVDAQQSLVAQAGKQQGVIRRLYRGRSPVPLTRKNLRNAVLLAEILGPPVSERKDYRLF